MRKVKVIELTGDYYDGYEAGPSIYDLAGITDWVEVNDDEYDALKQYVALYPYDHKNRTRVLLMEEQEPRQIKENIQKYLDKAKKLKQEKEEKDRKRIAAEKKRLDKLRQKKEEKEKKLLESLKSKYESD